MITDVKKNVAYSFLMNVADTAAPTTAKVNPTIAAGDFQVSTDGTPTYTNLSTLPTLSPAAGDTIVISLSAAEMNNDRVMVRAKDVAGAEWNENRFSITTVASTAADAVTDIATAQTDITELLGLGYKNALVDNTMFDANGNLLTSRLRVWDTKANAQAAGATGLLATYSTTGTFTGDDMDTFEKVRDS